MYSVIIVANGKGLRFNSNKMLAKIENKTVIQKTIEAFIDTNVDQIILVSSKEVFDCLPLSLKKLIQLTSGGETRSESVKCGLELVKNEYVLIHDGARPFISSKLIKNIMVCLKTSQAVIPKMNIVDCLKQNGKTVDRSEFFITQTPQGFVTELIKKAYEYCNNSFYDDAQLIEVKYPNIEIKYIEGEKTNIKITNPSDI